MKILRRILMTMANQELYDIAIYYYNEDSICRDMVSIFMNMRTSSKNAVRSYLIDKLCEVGYAQLKKDGFVV